MLDFFARLFNTSWPLFVTHCRIVSFQGVRLIVFAFSDNLSAENYKLSAESGLPGLSFLECMSWMFPTNTFLLTQTAYTTILAAPSSTFFSDLNSKSCHESPSAGSYYRQQGPPLSKFYKSPLLYIYWIILGNLWRGWTQNLFKDRLGGLSESF